jgi:hypothetical protein
VCPGLDSFNPPSLDPASLFSFSSSVVRLSFFSGHGLDNPYGLRLCGTTQLVNKTLDGLIAMGKTTIGNQVLPNGHGIPLTTESLLDPFTERLAGTGDPMVARWVKSAG